MMRRQLVKPFAGGPTGIFERGMRFLVRTPGNSSNLSRGGRSATNESCARKLRSSRAMAVRHLNSSIRRFFSRSARLLAFYNYGEPTFEASPEGHPDAFRDGLVSLDTYRASLFRK